jgi:hypothetical protein
MYASVLEVATFGVEIIDHDFPPLDVLMQEVLPPK